MVGCANSAPSWTEAASFSLTEVRGGERDGWDEGESGHIAENMIVESQSNVTWISCWN